MLLLSLALSQSAVLADEVAERMAVEEPLRFGSRTFGLMTRPTWTVYRGRHYLTAPQFAERVGDNQMIALLGREKRRQTLSAVIFVLGGTVATNTGTYLTLIGTAVGPTDPALGTTMIAAGGTLMLTGAVAYYGTFSLLMLRAPRRNRVDLYYSHQEAESWMTKPQAVTHSAAPVQIVPIVGPGHLGLGGRF